MDDITAMLSQVLADPGAMRQLQSVAASLGLTGGDPPAAQEAAAPAVTETAPSNVDLSALLSLLGGSTPAPPPEPPAAPDLSALSGLLGGLMGNAAQQQPQPQPANQNGTAALTALLGGGNSGGGQIPGLPFDLGTLLKLQQAMSTITANQANVQLLMALKPRLKAERAKKVDDAVRVMQLIQFLPLIKESGLFGDLSGGLGGIVSGIGDGLGGMLGGLLGRRQS
jgi:hypothetical protein